MTNTAIITYAIDKAINEGIIPRTQDRDQEVMDLGHIIEDTILQVEERYRKRILEELNVEYGTSRNVDRDTVLRSLKRKLT